MRSAAPGLALKEGVTKPLGRFLGVAAGTAVSVLLLGAGTASAQADPCPNAQFRTGASAHLPDCRAYEQVSPVDKNGFDVQYGTGTSLSAGPVSGGGSPIFSSDGAFAGQPFGSNEFSGGNYLAQRGLAGWETTALFPRPANASALVLTKEVAADFGSVLIESPSALTGDLAPDGGAYLRDVETGLVELLIADQGTEDDRYAASADLSHVAFMSNAVLTSDPGVPPAAAFPGFLKAYEWANGEIRLVGKQQDGTPFQDQTFIGSYTISSGTERSSSNAVSRDGAHIFFSTPASGVLSATTAVYRRSNGTTSVLASPSKRTDCADDPTCGGDGLPDPQPDPLGPTGKVFVTATPDGNRVFFTSPEELTDDANTGATRANSRRDLYRYDIAADELVDISAETNTLDGARVQGIVGTSDDGDWVYYVALGQVIAGEGTPGQPNVYLWHDDGSESGETRFISTLSAADSANWRQEPLFKASRVTPDGQHALFESSESGPTQVYLYDVQSNGGAGALTCVTCEPAIGSPARSTLTRTGFTTNPASLARNLLDDGSRAFFDSAAALVPQDTNGKVDAYMWEGGQISLLSTGKGPWDSRFYGATADGDDALVITREALVQQDGDTNEDIYDARVGGGVAVPVVPARCVGAECQGPPSGAPAFGDPASRSLQGRRGGASRPRVSVSIRGVTLRQRVRLARGQAIRLRVAVDRAGQVRMVARAKIGGRQRIVARGRAGAGKAGTVSVRVSLSKAARRALTGGSRLRVRLAVRSTGAPRGDALTLSLNPVSRKGR